MLLAFTGKFYYSQDLFTIEIGSHAVDHAHAWMIKTSLELLYL